VTRSWQPGRQHLFSTVVVASVLTVLLLGTGCRSSGTKAATAPTDGRSTGEPQATIVLGRSPRADVAAENAKPGTTAWQLPPSRLAGETDLAGYTDRVSARPGEPFRLFVSSSDGAFTVRAFRIGWYGGKGGRLVWASPTVPGRPQARPTLAPGRMVTTNWRPSLAVPTTSWPPGTYLLLLTAANGKQKYVPMTIRSESTRDAVVIVNAVATYQAYNEWGGYSLYNGPDKSFATRSSRVSFDRPYDGNGAHLLFKSEQALIWLAERRGVRLAYLTSWDLDADPVALAGARGVISPGHDEYWSTSMRAAVTKARDAGTNLAFLGANAVYWRVRFEAGLLGPGRVLAGYKSAATDPLKNRPDTTTKWRSLPFANPENSLTGMLYECFPAAGSFVVRRPDFFLFAGTGARRGSSYPGLVATEIDRAYPIAGTPRNLEVVAHSPATCGPGRRTFSDATYYTTRSGAGAFATGSMDWPRALRGPDPKHNIDAATVSFARKVTSNLLTAMAAGPLARRHPASPNLASVAASSSTSTGTGGRVGH
jgi:N,N-dimethylformamidase beta subunit-like, C-terminal